MRNRVVILIFFSFILSGCKFVRPFFIKNEKKEERKEKREEKKEVKKEKKQDSTDIVKRDTLKIPGYDTALARKIINIRNIQYNTLQINAKMHYKSDNDKQSFNANFRLQKSKIIWVIISAPIIGEIARAIIRPDSVKAYEKINKRAYRFSYANIQKLINIQIDFTTLQEIIVGNAIATEGAITDIKEVGNVNTIFIKGGDYNNQLSYNKTDSSLKQIQLQTVRAVSTSSILIAHSQFQMIDARYFSTQRDYHIQDVKGAANLSMDINKIEVDKELDFPFKIPANYKFQIAD